MALLGRAAMLPRWGVPLPGVHDEFSYLLAADTYASGRLANPPHPLWEHFETFHVLQQPAYASKYPPLPGLVMTFGQRLFGIPWIGVWLSVGLMCAAMCWMFQGWISPPWALLGGLMVATRIGIVSYWMNSYWGGAVAAAGGALVLGAAPRIVRDRRLRDVLAFAAGGVILLNSRPFEGFVLVLLTSVALVVWLSVVGVGWKTAALRIALPVALVGALALGAMAYQNYRVTGNALLPPYVAHDRQYAATSLFLWDAPHEAPVYRHAVLRSYWADWRVSDFRSAQADVTGEFFRRLGGLYGFCFELWPVLAVALIWPFRLKTRGEQWTALILGIFLIVTLAPLSGALPHYSAPIVALLYLRLLQGFSRLPSFRAGGKPIGSLILAGLLIAWIASNGRYLLQPEQAPQLGWERAKIAAQLEAMPGKQVVVVHYNSKHSVHDEWVYNRADIDGAKIVWAREMGPTEDAKLIRYYRDRRAWMLDADASPPKLTPYPEESALSSLTGGLGGGR